MKLQKPGKEKTSLSVAKNRTGKTTISKSPKKENRQTIIATKAASPLGAYPHARRAGNFLFLSGIGPRNAKDNSVPGLKLNKSGKIIKYDIEAECHAVFANVKAVLEACGSQWDHIIDVTVFLTHMKKDFPVYNKIYNQYFAGVQACRTTVEVKSLPTPIAIELKVIAHLD
ncbi:MAG: RidA family protein [Bacteroidetes bacterium]|nr:RidA family protein [Bacteroidota bacterium]